MLIPSQNENPLEASVKEAMLDNPSFSSPTRSSFDTPARTAEPTTPTSRERVTPRTRAASVLDASTRQHARTPTVRLGYKHPSGERKTPLARARKSSSRERLGPAFEGDALRTSQDSGRLSLAPRPTSLPNPSPDPQKRTQGPLTLIEKHADLLAYIAQKEREVADAKRTYDRKVAELEEVKKRWEVITARQGFHSTTTTTSSTAGKHHHHPPVPVRRTASSSSTGSTDLGAVAHGQPDLTTTAVEGSRRLFGHLMDSLSGIALSAEEEPSGGESEISDRKRDKAQMKRLIAGSGRENRNERRPSDASTAASDPGQAASSSTSAVDYTNIWDGLAPPKDWKEKLGNVMGVSAPT